MQAQNIFLDLHHTKIALKQWGDGSKPALVALHGWLDNANSFDHIAPLLSNFTIYAFDFPGHGLSSWRPPHTHYLFADYVHDVIAATDTLELESFYLLGHSMGAGVSCLVAGTFPNRIEKLALIDGLGPGTDKPEKSPQTLSLSIQTRLRRAAKQHQKPTYASVDEAADKTLKHRMPLNRESVLTILERGLDETPDGVSFRHDPQLRNPSMLRFTEEQLNAFLSRISCPTLLVRPTEGWPVDESLFQSRFDALSDIDVQTTPGGHHVHLDEPEAVAKILNDFFNA